MVTGFFCIVIGVVVLILDVVSSERLSEFFNVDISQDLEEVYHSKYVEP